MSAKLLPVAVGILFFATNVIAQDDMRRIDSIIIQIDSYKDVAIINECDTMAVSHSDSYLYICTDFYFMDGKLVKVISKSGYGKMEMLSGITIYPSKPPTTMGACYFKDDQLIKSTEQDLYDSIKVVNTYYFPTHDVSRLKAAGEQTSKYMNVNSQLKYGEDLLRRSKTLKTAKLDAVK